MYALPQGRRGDDGKVTVSPRRGDGRSKHFPQKFEAFALTLMRQMPVNQPASSSATAILGCGGSLRPRQGGALAVHIRQRGVGGV